MPEAFTSLESVKLWLTKTDSSDDRLLSRLIEQASRFILSTINRSSLFQHNYTDVYDGSGSARQMLRNWPVLSVSALTIGTQTISAAASYGQHGFTLEAADSLPPGRPQALNLQGYVFAPGTANIAVTYQAGYVVSNEPQSVPLAANYSLAVNAPYGIWAVDQGVTHTDGTPLAAVAANPSQGQYVVVGDGVYQFSAADAGVPVLISYSFVPADIEQACIDLVAYWYESRTRIGLSSKSMGGETTSFLTRDMPATTRSILSQYKSVLLV